MYFSTIDRAFSTRLAALAVCLLPLLSVAAVAAAEAPPQGTVAVPANIQTRDVPPLPAALQQRLQRYGHTRGAFLLGWQGDSLLISTRFAETEQLHRVDGPLAYRQQLTYLDEPLGGLAVPRGGAKDQAILSWDVGGSEFRQLFLFDLHSGRSRMVSDGRSLYDDVIWAADEQSFIYVTTERNGRNWDIHRQDLQGNITVLLETEQGYWYPVDWSADGQRLLIKHRVSINESSIHELDLSDKRSGLQRLLGGAPGVAIGDAKYANDGGIYFTSDEGTEQLQLRRLNRDSGEISVINPERRWGVEGFVLSPAGDKLAYSINAGGLSQLKVVSVPRHRAVPVPQLPAGIILSLSFAGDGNRLGVSINSAVSPTDVYVVDLAEASARRWTRSEVGGLDTSRFVDARLIEYPSFDGRNIPAFVFQPPGAGPHPVVILIHGGPEAQYRPYFSTTVQSYVNEMGVAVIAPNVRGSNGYGKSYLQLDNGKLREDSVRDIGALLDWLQTREQFDSSRVAVMGGSYGGYMVLASMVHFGERLTAAVESVGISNFVTFLENTQPYRQDMRRVEYGDERVPEMRTFLQGISPLNHVDKMVTPVLISQGANDPRVPASESEQMREALSRRGIPVWYILALDEGHGFRKKVNRDYDRLAKFAFLEAYLTGDSRVSQGN